MTLNPEQQDALQHVLDGRSVFLTGPGGTGKSFLIRRITEVLSEKNKKVAVTALTGCAALLLGKEAKTIHSWAGIGLGRDPADKIVHEIKTKPWKNKVLRRWLLTHVLIIDEISMMTPQLLELLDQVGRMLRRQEKPLGGIQLVMVGDFFQLPPVVKKDEFESEIKQQFVFESPLWDELGLYVIQLNQIMRQADPVFQGILNEARWGTLYKDSQKQLLARQKDEWQTLQIKPTLLFSRRAEVEMINERNLSALKGPLKRFEAKTVLDATLAKGITLNSPEVRHVLSRLDRDAPYKATLEVKEGAQVMLIYNLDQENGLVNGSRGVITGFSDTVPSYPMVLFKDKAAPIMVAPQSWESEDVEGLKRSQVPLILAYAVTIHKCQGATLDSALIDIGPSTFEVGQAYVALSRVKSLDSLYIYDMDPKAFKAHPKVCRYYETL